MNSLLPLATFVFVTSITPGPNNLMLAASGMGFGLRRTVPHIAGIAVGFSGLLLLCGFGIGALVASVPGSEIVLASAGSGYLVWLAWRLRVDSLSAPAEAAPKPLSLIGAAAFQFINPKAWLMALTCAGTFLPALGADWPAVLLMTLIGAAINLPCVTVWAALGASIRSLLDRPAWRRRCNVALVLLTLYAAAAVWL